MTRSEKELEIQQVTELRALLDRRDTRVVGHTLHWTYWHCDVESCPCHQIPPVGQLAVTHGRCLCGEYSEPMTSKNRQQLWFRTHKLHVVSGRLSHGSQS